MSTPLSVGQMLVLTNLKTRQDAICRVVKIRTYSNSASYVEVEFTHRQPGYWGVSFEAEATESLVNSSPSATSARLGAADTKAPTSTPSSTQQGGSKSNFIHLGSQEHVQPPASSTSASKQSRPATTQVPARKPADATVTGTKPPQSSATSRSGLANNAQLQAPASSAGAAALSKSVENLATGQDADALSPSTHDASDSHLAARVAGETLSSRLGSESTAEGHPGASSTNWLLIAACGAALFVAAGGGYLFLHHRPSTASSPASRVVSQSVAPLPAQPKAVSNSPVTVTPSTSRATVAPASTTREASPPVVKAPKEPPVVRESYSSNEQPSQPEPASAPAAAPSAPAAKTAMPSVFGTLNAHPITPSRNVSAAAPNVDAGVAPSAPGNALLGITSPAVNDALPAPALNSNIPIPVGGRVKEPQLLTRVLPDYPAMARQAHTQGDVVVQITVDKAGNVVAEKALSGPAVLRQAAMDAVRRWKYEPTTLDGQAISVQLLVTLRFQL